MRKQSITINGHRTSISLEAEFLTALKEIARSRGQTLAELVGVIDSGQSGGNLTPRLRLYVLGYYRNPRSALGLRKSH